MWVSMMEKKEGTCGPRFSVSKLPDKNGGVSGGEAGCGEDCEIGGWCQS